MALPGNQAKQLVEALCNAFPDLALLQQMYRYVFEDNLNEVAGGANLRAVVFNLITHVEATGETQKLVMGAWKHNPGNQDLLVFKRKFELHQHLLKAFPTLDQLRQMAPDQVQQVLTQTPHEQDVGKVIWKLIDLAEAGHKTAALVHTAAQARPDDRELWAFAQQFPPDPAPPPTLMEKVEVFVKRYWSWVPTVVIVLIALYLIPRPNGGLEQVPTSESGAAATSQTGASPEPNDGTPSAPDTATTKPPTPAEPATEAPVAAVTQEVLAATPTPAYHEALRHWWNGNGTTEDARSGAPGIFDPKATYAEDDAGEPYAFEFNGQSRVDTGITMTYTTRGGSLSTWIKTNQEDSVILTDGGYTDGQAGILLGVKQSEVYVGFGSGDQPGALPTQPGSGVDVSDDAWHHIVVTWGSRNRILLYVDCQQYPSALDAREKLPSGNGVGTLSTGGPIPELQPLLEATDPYFVGLIDDVRVYDTPLQPKQIEHMYYDHLGRTCG